MPRVHRIKARKDYPEQNIHKGDFYYKWSTRLTVGKSYISRLHRSATAPTRSQLTNSDYYRSIYSIFDGPSPKSPDDVRAMAEQVREVGQEQQEKLDNMPEGLQQGSTGEMIQERIDACEQSADDLDTLADEWEQAEQDHEEDEEDVDKDDFDPSEFIDRVSEYEPEA